MKALLDRVILGVGPCLSWLGILLSSPFLSARLPLLSNFYNKTHSKFQKKWCYFGFCFAQFATEKLFTFILFEEPFTWDIRVLNISMINVLWLPTKNNHTNPHPSLTALFFIVASPLPSPKSTSKNWKTLGDKFPARPQELPSFSPCSRWPAHRLPSEMLQQSPRTSLHSAFYVIATNIPSGMYSGPHHSDI